jgi:hypothetical protein
LAEALDAFYQANTIEFDSVSRFHVQCFSNITLHTPHVKPINTIEFRLMNFEVQREMLMVFLKAEQDFERLGTAKITGKSVSIAWFSDLVQRRPEYGALRGRLEALSPSVLRIRLSREEATS